MDSERGAGGNTAPRARSNVSAAGHGVVPTLLNNH